MADWLRELRYDPLPPLLGSGNPAMAYLARRDLMGAAVPSPREVWNLPAVVRLVSKQNADGSWSYPGGGRPHLRSSEDYAQLETYRSLGILVEQFAMTREHGAVRRAAHYLFSCQTPEGDMRGIYGRQYTPNYTAGILELLIKAGYGQDRRVLRGFRWLTEMRQVDGGWAIPLRTRGLTLDAIALGRPTVQADTARPFSHLVTGVVLRAFAAHPEMRRSPVAIKAARLLTSRLFQRDAYPDRGAPEYWTRFSFPFWFTDLASALDSLSQVSRSRADPQIQHGLEWLAGRQRADGTWAVNLLKAGKGKQVDLWVGLGICRLFRRYFSRG